MRTPALGEALGSLGCGTQRTVNEVTPTIVGRKSFVKKFFEGRMEMDNVLAFKRSYSNGRDPLEQTAAEKEMKTALPFMRDRGPRVNIRLGFVFGLLPSVILTEIDFQVKCSEDSIAHEGEIWIGLTYNDLESELGGLWKASAIKKAVTELRELGVLWVKNLSRLKQDRTNYYAIDYDNVYELCKQVYGKGNMKGE